MDAATETYLQALASTTVQVLGDNLTGIYLHGSAVLGGYLPSRSDLDILILVASPLSTTDQTRLSRALSQSALPCPAVGLELSVVLASVAAAQPTTRAPPFEMHMTTAERDSKVIGRDAGASGDEDLMLHFWVARERGRALLDDAGPAPAEAFAPVPRGVVRAQVRRELLWVKGEAAVATGEYAVLNAARALGMVRTGRVMGKVEGGRWALGVVGERWEGVVAWALRRQMGEKGEEGEEIGKREVGEFVDFVIREIDGVVE
ncbi:nucleotidyltransferase activity protein [Lecanicillium sp. MT-2017a]|nr:nucleotidyltransferase activity protein [Lecanicillium sp. MT-2017a]